MESVLDRFKDGPGAQWRAHLVGAGRLEATGTSLKFVTGGAVSESYSNAQLDDYQGLSRSRFYWRPPLRLTVRARFSHTAEQLRGTAGFGFWNDPLLMTQRRMPALPRAVWFFYASSPSNMKFDTDTPGHGWKAATINAQNAIALLWAPLAPLLVPLMNLSPAYRVLWPPIQRALRIRETLMQVEMSQWHTYELYWGRVDARFSIVEQGAATSSLVLHAPCPPGPLGFVMWQDNQYLVLTPWGRIRWGLLDVPSDQWMEVDYLEILPLEGNQTR